MKIIRLNSEKEIPQVGLGLWQVHLPGQVEESISAALAAGYRHFDTAQIYLNERFVGRTLEKSDIERSELFSTTKIATFNIKEDRVVPSFERSLKRLRTDYVDLLLLHFPKSKTRQAAWLRMEEIYTSGKAKSIGVSNYTVKHLEELLATCKVRPAVNQVELHVFLQQPELIKYCQEQGIVVEAYSPLAHGYGLDNPVIVEMAKKHGKSPAQIMLRWCIDIGAVPLPKSTHPGRIQSNADIFDFSLDKKDLACLSALDENHRTCWDPTNVA